MMSSMRMVLGFTLAALLVIGCNSGQELTALNGDGASGKAVLGLGDRVWHDANQNGLQDLEESGLAGIEVILQDCLGNIVLTDTTDASGAYLFSGFDAGDYQVRFALPDSYAFTMQGAGTDTTLDSDTDPMTGLTACLSLPDSVADGSIDAGMYHLVAGTGCAHGKGYWKNHLDEVADLLPLTLGAEDGSMSLLVDTAEIAYGVLQQHTYGHPSNGITKLYARLLTAKLNIANGADGSAAEVAIAEADAFLADHGPDAWDSLSHEEQRWIQQLKTSFRVTSVGDDCYDGDHDHDGDCDDGDDHDDEDDEDEDEDEDDDI
jgi:hypothetical protein